MGREPGGAFYGAAAAVFVLTVIVTVSLAMRSTVTSSGCAPGVPCDANGFSPDSGPAFLSLVVGLGLVAALVLTGFVVAADIAPWREEATPGMAIRRRARVAIVAVSASVLIGLPIGFGIVHHLRGARFVGSVSPVQVSSDQCVDMLMHLPYGFSSQNAGSTCQSAAMAAWFGAEVSNVGHRMAFLKYCNVIGRDRLGHELFVGELSMFQGNPAGFPLDPGKSVAWEWYLTRQNTTPIPFQPQAQATHYELRCPAIDYGGPPPV